MRGRLSVPGESIETHLSRTLHGFGFIIVVFGVVVTVLDAKHIARETLLLSETNKSLIRYYCHYTTTPQAEPARFLSFIIIIKCRESGESVVSMCVGAINEPNDGVFGVPEI